MGSLTIPVTTDIEGEMYTCSMSSSCGDQEKVITISTIGMCICVCNNSILTLSSIPVPDDWATVDITNSTNQNALHNTNFALTCTVRVISGMNLAPSVEWVGPDGVMIMSDVSLHSGSGSPYGGSGSGGSGSGFGGSGSNLNSTFILTLSFNPVLSSDGGRYTCRAAISVPWMATMPPLISSSVDMSVTSKAIIIFSF